MIYFKVEFLENYSKETARKKLNYLVQFGLDAYFSHKVINVLNSYSVLNRFHTFKSLFDIFRAFFGKV